jgi:hypothetical protein
MTVLEVLERELGREIDERHEVIDVWTNFEGVTIVFLDEATYVVRGQIVEEMDD